MFPYRIDLMSADNRIAASRDIACVDDEEARLRARSLQGGFAAIEIWCGQRRVRPAVAAARPATGVRLRDAVAC